MARSAEQCTDQTSADEVRALGGRQRRQPAFVAARLGRDTRLVTALGEDLFRGLGARPPRIRRRRPHRAASPIKGRAGRAVADRGRAWSGGGAAELEALADYSIRLSPPVPEHVSPIAMTLVFQLLGYYLGVARGHNPDTLRTDQVANARAWLTSFPLDTH